ncbi:MAG: hypothetical protein ACFBZ8_00990 [Opitutales bacterium]
MFRIITIGLVMLSGICLQGALVDEVETLPETPPALAPVTTPEAASPNLSSAWLSLTSPDGEVIQARIHDYSPKNQSVRLFLQNNPRNLVTASLAHFSEGSRQIIRDWHNRRIIQRELRFNRDREAGKRRDLLFVTYPFSLRNNTFHTMRDIEVRYVVDTELHSVEQYRLVGPYERERQMGIFFIPELKDGGRWEQRTEAVVLREYLFERVKTRYVDGFPVSEIDQKSRRERIRGKWFGIYYRGELLQEYSDPDAFAPIGRELAAEIEAAPVEGALSARGSGPF